MKRLFIFFTLCHLACSAQNRDSIDLVRAVTINKQRTSHMEPTYSSENSVNASVLRYNEFIYDHRVSAYKWQLLSSKIIFGLVVVIVLVGLLLSYLQFTVNSRLPSTKSADSTIEISEHQLKVKSAVIGLVILVISLAFFYLYLQFAYHIVDPEVLRTISNTTSKPN